MLLEKVIREPEKALIHMERYVNKGSPSGFTFRYTVSEKYTPHLGLESFPLPYYVIPWGKVLIFNVDCLDNDLFATSEAGVSFPVHPDMVQTYAKLRDKQCFLPEHPAGFVPAVPLSNMRTLLIRGTKSPFIVKLDYKGVIGRVERSLPLRKAVAGPEISRELVECLEKNDAPTCFAMLKETEARVAFLGSSTEQEVGMVFRESYAYPRKQKRSYIPFFALFSTDKHAPGDSLLLNQILQRYSDPIEALIARIIRPLIVCYCYLTFSRGLIPEINAQNILLEIDDNGEPMRILHRDFQGYQKDFTIRRRNGLSIDFLSDPYKCIDEEQDASYYYKRHSFSYDFKIGCYIFDELLDVVCPEFTVSRKKLIAEIVEVFHSVAEGREKDHFRPIDKWYCHNNIILTGARPYIEKHRPKYRRVSN